MLDGLPTDWPGRYSMGSWGTLLAALVFGLGAGGLLFGLLWYAASLVGEEATLARGVKRTGRASTYGLSGRASRAARHGRCSWRR